MGGTLLDNHASVPLVSIVIPTYNQARFLGEAIESGLAQDYPHFEIVVVDNSSTDDTQAVIAKYADKLKSVVQPNHGPSSARNRGVAEALGEYIVFLDGDDILDPTCASARVGMLVEHPDAGLVVGAFKIVSKERTPMWTEELRDQSTIVTLEQILASMYGPTCGLTVRKSIYDEVGGFDASYRIAEDSDFAIRMTAKATSLYDPEPRAEYRQAGASLSRNYAVLYDSYTRMARQNQDLLGDRNRYWAIVGPHLRDRLANVIFGKLIKEKKLAALADFFALFVKRPGSVACFLYWIKRILVNRLLKGGHRHSAL